jgi:hypothetical protein
VTARPSLAVIAAGAVAGFGAAGADDDDGGKPGQLEGVTDVEQLSLADLLDTQVDVASRTSSSSRSPTCSTPRSTSRRASRRPRARPRASSR